MQIVCALKYWSGNLVCFDPEKVVAKLRAVFPHTLGL